ncbi:MAG: apolipoprotein N-acyltransferase [Candidatus Omnitrophota bacterium]
MNRKILSFLLSILSAIFLIFTSLKPFIWGLAWVGFVPLFFAIQERNKWQVFLLSYFTGVLFFLGAIYWLAHVTVSGLIILVLYLGLYFAIFGVVFSYIYRPEIKNMLLVSSCWVILEYIRNYILTGFGWAILGYSQYNNLPIIQIADITGVYGVSFLLILSNLTIYSFIRYKQKYPLILLMIVVVISYGYFKLNKKVEGEGLNIAVVQGNIPQDMKWDMAHKEFIKDKYFSLTKKILLDNPDLIIWPEASVPVLLTWPKEVKQYLADLSRENLLIGAIIKDREYYYNSAVLVTKNKLQRYDKIHLVPFGEYIPLKNIFPFLETVVGIGDFTPGKDYSVFSLNKQEKLAVLICFEDIFSGIARQFTKKGANFLVNITNDAWFGDTSAPFQHMSFSIFRAVENRRFVIRSANTGISCFINSKGIVYSKISNKVGKSAFIEGSAVEKITLLDKKTFYTRFGDLFILLNLLFVLFNIYKINLRYSRE